MKILNLLERPNRPNIKNINVNRDMSDFLIGKDKFTHHGSFSGVKNSSDPHSVNKVNKTPMKEDEGFRVFVDYIVNNGYADNIHFPRVHRTKRIAGPDGYFIDSFKVEKLLPWEDIDGEELLTYLNRHVGIEGLKSYPMVKDGSTKYVGLIMRDLGKYMDDLIDKRSSAPVNAFKSDSLNSAIRIIGTLLKFKDDADPDIHEDNIMFRRYS